MNRFAGNKIWTLLIIASVSLLASCGDSSNPANDPLPEGHALVTGSVALSPEVQRADVYVIGQEGRGVETDANGSFSLLVDMGTSGFVAEAEATPEPPKRYVLIIQNHNGTHGKKQDVDLTEGTETELPEITLAPTGEIIGKATLQGQTDHSGTMVYIPGTSFMAITDSTGNFTISGVPEGTYDFLRSNNSGYHCAVLSHITVTSASSSDVPDQQLLLSTGASGQIAINGGEEYTNSLEVMLSIGATDNAVLMMISEDDIFVNASWQPLQSIVSHTFSSEGLQSIYVKFADANGLESGTYTDSIHVDTNPLAEKIAPVNQTSDSLPTLEWEYPAPMQNPAYHVQVATDHLFANIIEDVTGLSSPSYTLSDPLDNFSTYYWRVAIIDESGYEWNMAGPWSFSVELNTVTLTSPANLSTTNNDALTFQWEPNAVAASYILSLSTTPDLSGSSDFTVSGTSYSLVTQLPNTSSTAYYWAVTPVDGNGVEGTRSDIWVFTLDTVAPAGSISINNNASTTASPSVALRLSADDMNGTGVAAYYISEDPASTPVLESPGWNDITPSTSYLADVPFTMGGGSGVKFVYVWFKDTAGNVSGVYSDSILLLQWTTSVAAWQNDVGRYSSLALDSANNAHIVHYDSSFYPGYLKYTTNTSGNWVTTIVDDSVGGRHVGTSIAIDGSDRIHISYQDDGNLNYATLDASGSWIINTVDADPDIVGELSSLAVDSSGKVHICYVNYTKRHLKYATGNLGSWTIETIDASGGAVYQGDLALDANDKVHISYRGGTYSLYELKYATGNLGSWTIETVDSSNYSLGDYNSIVVDSNNVVHISYTADLALKYATGSPGSWDTEFVDTKGDVGRWSSIALDPDGNIHMSYYDLSWLDPMTNGNLKYATNITGSWTTGIVDSSDNVGEYCSLAVDSNGKAHISYFDRRSYDLKYAHSK